MWKVSDSEMLYGLDRWGQNYFKILESGELAVGIEELGGKFAPILPMINHLGTKALKTPIILRFPQILKDRIKILATSFENSICEFEYKNQYHGVFPMKVNHRREVVTQIHGTNSNRPYGLEVGSKAEAMAALCLEPSDNSMFIFNGYKDDTFLKLAFLSASLNRTSIIIIEELSEIHRIIALSNQTGVKPLLGLRCRLYSRGSGRWEESGGEYSKFGLSVADILTAIKKLKDADMIDCLTMLHFHLGSQITDIRKIQKAVREATRVYCKVRADHAKVTHLNIGGGLGVDYDGSRTSFESSANYSVREYTNSVVYTIKEICDEEGVSHPVIVSESGRAITAYHAMLVVDVKSIKKVPCSADEVKVEPTDTRGTLELHDLFENISAKNYREYYHDGLVLKEELTNLFNLGHLSLEERAKGETLFWGICKRASGYARETKFSTEEFQILWRRLTDRYLCNFSIFQSVPDNWAIDNLFPILPIHRLNQQPGAIGTLADITCDSDGKIDKFIDLHHTKRTLELHPIEKDEPYYLGFFLIGAYQDILGDFHNLFGQANEAMVSLDGSGGWEIKDIIKGSSISDMLTMMNYDVEEMMDSLANKIRDSAEEHNNPEVWEKQMLDLIKGTLQNHTYLDRDRKE